MQTIITDKISLKNFYKNNGVIVIGGHVQGLGIIRTLGKEGISTIVLDKTKHNIAKHSKYCNAFYNYISDENLINKLIEISNIPKYKNWLVLPTSDFHVKLLSTNKHIFVDRLHIGTDDWNNVKMFYNKKNTYKIAENTNVPYPKSWFPSNEQNIDNYQLTFPCIIKPAIMHEFYEQLKKKVFVCNNLIELKENYRLACKIINPENIIIQEIITGNNENQYSVGVLFDKKNALQSLTARRKRQHPIDFGNATTFAETVNIPELNEYANRILKEVNYVGVAEVEFKYDSSDKKYKLLEVNPRTWKWHYISLKANIPILLHYYHLVYNIKFEYSKPFIHASWQHLTTDLPTKFKMIINGNFIKSGIKRKTYAVFDLKDIKPYIFELLYLPYLIKTR